MISNSTRLRARLRPVLPANEATRLASLHFLDVLDNAPQEHFDRVARIAQHLFSVPLVTVSFIDADREWFKSRIGTDLTAVSRELSFASHTIMNQGILTVPDAKIDLRFFESPFVRGSSGIRFYAGYPIRAWNGFNIGALSIMDCTSRSLTSHQKAALVDLTAILEREIALSEMQLVDELTGLMTRRGLGLIASHIVPRASRNGENLSMLFLDIKGLDGLNDQFGRTFGDAALVMIASVLRETLRSADIPARMRGDDFAILLPDTGSREAAVVISRIEHELEHRKHQRALPKGIALRFSQATLDPSSDDFTLEHLIALAGSAD